MKTQIFGDNPYKLSSEQLMTEKITHEMEEEQIEKITCNCNDLNCPKEGEEDEVAYHIENCPCYTCHHHYGKLN